MNRKKIPSNRSTLENLIHIFEFKGCSGFFAIKKYHANNYNPCLAKLSHKKRKDSLEGSLDRVLFAVKLEFPKILVPRLPQNKSNVNIESAGKSKQPYSFCENPLEAPMPLFYCSDIDLCFQFVMLSGNCAMYDCSSMRATPVVSQYRGNTEEATLLQLLLVVGWKMTTWKVKLKIKHWALANYSHFYPPSSFNIHRVINFEFISAK